MSPKIKVKGKDDCWNGPREYYAHRKVYQLFNGQIPEGMVVAHLCNNAKCNNPAHLEAMTQSDNVKQAYTDNRRKSAKGRKLRARLSAATVRAVRKHLADGMRVKEVARLLGIDNHTKVTQIKMGITYRKVA